jgi:putative NADPH-quinone reductase
MIAVAGATKEQLIKRDYEAAINTSLNIGILDYCGIKNSEIMFLKETNQITKSECLSYIKQAYDKGISF